MRGDDHDGIVTHGRSREFRMHMKNPAQPVSGCIRFNDLNFHQATFAEYPCPIRLHEGGPVFIFKCGSRKEKYLKSVTI